jgi:hypothetical protein
VPTTASAAATVVAITARTMRFDMVIPFARFGELGCINGLRDSIAASGGRRQC